MHRQMHRQIDKCTDKWTYKQTDKCTDKCTGSQTNAQTNAQTKLMHRRAGWQMHRQAMHRQADRQTDKKGAAHELQKNQRHSHASIKNKVSPSSVTQRSPENSAFYTRTVVIHEWAFSELGTRLLLFAMATWRHRSSWLQTQSFFRRCQIKRVVRPFKQQHPPTHLVVVILIKCKHSNGKQSQNVFLETKYSTEHSSS